MYVNPFLAGILATILCELVVLVIAVWIHGRNE